ncbi:MAG: cob(I)yrinic acid a,c-diamide adenosyltransferase [Sphingobacteriaceae bacterium]|nr:cob(I)yrinic acid a,c-diamide adenosyltransferase [Sphingobacteriaceae bacterium]MBK7818765.1 cob(I)yrinic acid a,c-diamide adenosyltransferase [Sphingobacteriaceae bacterium]
MKIYTKTGDKGETSLIGGTRVPKHHIRIEAYGTVDELNSYIGLVRDLITEKHAQFKLLVEVQDRLFTMGSILAADPEKNKMKLPELKESDIELLEKAIDEMDKVLPPMKHFVLPGGHATISQVHIARCICRRAERNVLHLNEVFPVNDLTFKYLNRLSDYLFTLSRQLAIDYKAKETPWLPRQ